MEVVPRGILLGMINAGEHIIIFGMTGSGKSTLTGKIAGLFQRRIIFDRLQEWQSAEFPTASSFEEFKNIYRENFQRNEFTIIFEPAPGMAQDELLETTNNILALVYQVESHTGKGIVLIFEEVWLYAPIHSIPTWFQETMLTGRHHRISVVGNSQRPAHVSKTLVSQARHVFVGQFFEARDKKYFEETFGRIPELENPPEKFSFWWFRTNEKPLLITTD